MDHFRIAVVTGAGQGIGKEIALSLSSENYAVGVNDIRFENAEALVAEIITTGNHAMALPGDVSVETDVRKMISSIQKSWGRIDVLINNAGLVDQQGPIIEQDLQIWERLVDVHLKGTYLMSKTCAPLMFSSKQGRIVNISSIAGILTFPSRTAYGPAKSGVIKLTQILALEWANRGITVNAVAPGYVKTEFIAEMVENGILDEKTLAKRTPLGRIATPKDIANAVMFLVSDNANFITGHTLVVDGGWSAYGFV